MSEHIKLNTGTVYIRQLFTLMTLSFPLEAASKIWLSIFMARLVSFWHGVKHNLRALEIVSSSYYRMAPVNSTTCREKKSKGLISLAVTCELILGLPNDCFYCI